jgi:hypothetical protein
MTRHIANPVFVLGFAASLALPLAACSSKNKVEAPADHNVCFHVAPLKDGSVRFNKLDENVSNIESCAAALEGMRLKFLRIGGQMQEIAGAYNGQFLFLQKDGVFMSTKYDGSRYLLLVRTGDGRLAMVGAMPQSQ